MAEKQDALFVHNYENDYGAHHWDSIPDDLWWTIVRHLNSLEIDGIGFQDVCASTVLARLGAFPEMPHFRCMGAYRPYHGKSAPSIAVFELDDGIRSVLLSERFDQWNQANDRLPFDEIVFFSGQTARLMIVPYENLIALLEVSRDDLSRFKSLDGRLSREKKCTRET